jgi:nitrogenase molybdenum-iron protein alpha/beta subunit
VPVEVDGILNGGSYQAREITLKRLCTLIDKDIEPDKKSVNIIGYSDTTDKALMMVDDTKRLIEGLGLSINCRFLDDNTFSEFKAMKKGSIDLMYIKIVPNRHTCMVLEKELGIPWYKDPMPVGLRETEEWIDGFGERMGVSADVRERLKDSFRKDFESFRKENEGRFKGLRTVIYCPTATNLNWLFEILAVLGIEVTNIYCPTNSKWNHNDDVFFSEHKIDVECDIDYDDLCDRLEKVKPDMVLGSNQMLSRLTLPHYNFRYPRAGVRSAIEYGKRIIRMMEVNSI